MANFNDTVLFGDTSLADIFKQIHKKNKETDKQINELIDILKPLAGSNAGSAVMLMPTVKDLIDVNVKNNEQLIKMAGIAQRAATTSAAVNNDITSLINSDEIQQLLLEQENIQKESNKLLESVPAQKQLENK